MLIVLENVQLKLKQKSAQNKNKLKIQIQHNRKMLNKFTKEQQVKKNNKQRL